MAKKAPNPTDRYVGARVRMRRLMLGMSQTVLGEALGLTYQQVQKYENGANRVGASRLQHIAQILQVPVAFFFENGPNSHAQERTGANAPSLAFVTEFLTSADGIALVTGYVKIKHTKLRRCIVDLVVRLAVSGD